MDPVAFAESPLIHVRSSIVEAALARGGRRRFLGAAASPSSKYEQGSHWRALMAGRQIDGISTIFSSRRPRAANAPQSAAVVEQMTHRALSWLGRWQAAPVENVVEHWDLQRPHVSIKCASF